MTPDEIRIAIAECCGWGGFENVEVGGEFLIGVPPHNEITEKLLGPRRISNWTPRCDVPDYPHDLNACAQFERALKTDDLIDYAEWLGATSNEMHMKSWVVLLRATALQRCEAFLRVNGKWKEATP